MGRMRMGGALPDEFRRCFYGVLFEIVIKNNKTVNAKLLEKVMEYLMQNIGELVSAKKIADYFTNNGMPVTHNTIMTYLKLLEDAHLVYKVHRYDLLHKKVLKTLDKYYVLNTAMRSEVVRFSKEDYGSIFENIVYFELLNREYDIMIGKLRKDNIYDIDFIATKGNEVKYYQILISLKSTMESKKKIAILKGIKNSHEKIVLTLDKVDNETVENGIRYQNIIDFFLEK